jgi:hypothetical protein
MLEIAIAQRDVLARWTPATSVPEFDLVRAAGNAGHWNNLPTNQQKGGKKERKPPLTAGQPDHSRFEAFLRSRTTEDNETLRDLFSTREPGEGGWEKYTFRNWKEADLLTQSQGHYAWRGKPEYETYHHGMKMEALYSILAGIETQAGWRKASSDRQSGQRFNADKKGVYFHATKDIAKAQSYAHSLGTTLRRRMLRAGNVGMCG